jgi:hypothetical protein
MFFIEVGKDSLLQPKHVVCNKNKQWKGFLILYDGQSWKLKHK